MLSGIFHSIFKCAHRKTTFPMTPNRRGRTYITCLDCGQEFDYDWKTMRIGGPVNRPATTAVGASIAAEAHH